MRKAMPLLLTLAVLALALAVDAAAEFGAHPQWSRTTLLIGGALGIATAFAAGFLPGPALIRIGVFAVLAAFFLWAAQVGGTQFAASYGDDAQAGQLWYLGWIAAPAALAALLYTASAWLLNQR